MNITVLSRALVPSFNPDAPFIWISITDPGKEHLKEPQHFTKHLAARLCLNFWDSETVHQVPGGFWTDDNRPPELPLRDEDLFQPAHARQIIDFGYDQARATNIQMILVNCEGGYSRSPAVAATLARLFKDKNLEGSLLNGKCPNARVYRLILLEASKA